MIAPVRKSVNHARTVVSIRETGWEQQQEVRLRSDSTVWNEFAFGIVGHCFLCCNQFSSAVVWSLPFPIFWSCVCHDMRFTTLRTRPVNIDRKQTLFLDAGPFDSLHLSRCRLSSLEDPHDQKKGQPSNTYVEELIFSIERPKINSQRC